MNTKSYLDYLKSQGSCIGDITKKDSNIITNLSFKDDSSYKKVYVFTKDGWKWVDAKFQKHRATSITSDEVDYFLQFRPEEKYEIGYYVIIPEENVDINLKEKEIKNPFLQPIEERTEWWMIVDKTNTNMFKRYSVLKCNWNIRWIYDNKIQNCFGCVRDSKSYTSGIWTRADYSAQLDNISSIWIPNMHHVYGDNLEDFELSDTCTINHGVRFMLSANHLHPDVYRVSKIISTTPLGLIKLTLKEDEYNKTTDNLDLMIANYYNSSGQVNIEIKDNQNIDDKKISQLYNMVVTSSGILELGNIIDDTIPEQIELGKTYYYTAEFSDENIEPIWKIELLSPIPNSDKDISYYENLIKINEFDDTTISIKVSKASSIKGLQYKLIVSDNSGEYKSFAILEVE